MVTDPNTPALDDLVSTFYHAFAGHPELLADVVTPDWEDVPLAPGQGPGPEGAAPVIRGLQAALYGLEIVVHRVVDGRDADGVGTIATRCEIRGRHTGELVGAPPSGRAVSIALHEFHDVVDGRIRRTHHLKDWAGFLAQVSGAA